MTIQDEQGKTPFLAEEYEYSDEQTFIPSILAHYSRESMIVTNLQGNIIYWNEGACAIFGYSAGEMLGKSPALLYPDQDEQLLAQDLQDILNGQDYRGEWKGRRKDGASIWVDIQTTLLRNREGEIVGFIGVSSDITARKEAEERLKASEERFRALLERSTDAISLLDREGRRLYSTPSSTRILGYDHDGVVGEDPFSYIHPDDVAHVQQTIAALLKQPGKSLPANFRVRHLNGSWVWIEGTGTNLLDHPGVQALVVNYRDITEQREAQEAQRRLAAIVESSTDAIISKTIEGIITDWNEAAERLFGYSSSEALGQPLSIIIPPELQAEEDNIIRQLLQGKPIKQYETLRRRKDGSLVPVSLSISPIKDQDGNIVGAAKIARDITERREQEQLKDMFIGMASHELKTPLTSLKGFLHLLERHLEKAHDEQGQSYLKRVNHQVNRITRLVADFLDISKIRAGKLEYHKEAIALDELVQEVVETVQKGSPSHRILVKGQAEATVFADRVRIGQVLINLLNNAVRYSPNADTVIVHLCRNQENAHVSVQDFGIGISKEHQRKIFDRYYQVGDADNHPSAGMGLGLYLAREIISHHHGSIKVESTPGKGATFSFTLPVEKTEENLPHQP